jgi:hypothetical protein
MLWAICLRALSTLIRECDVHAFHATFPSRITALFETEANVWQEVDIPFSEMVPTYRRVLVPVLSPLDPSSIRSFGFMIADEQQGDILLEVDSISAVDNGTRVAVDAND